MEDKQIIVQCNDGCGLVVLDKFYDEDIYSMSYYTPVFYSDQESFWYRVKDRTKMIWYIITGKKYCLFEIILTKEKMKEFANKVKELTE